MPDTLEDDEPEVNAERNYVWGQDDEAETQADHVNEQLRDDR